MNQLPKDIKGQFTYEKNKCLYLGPEVIKLFSYSTQLKIYPAHKC